MNIDFHYGVIYAVARSAGMDVESAQTLAHACQYVDDATTAGVLQFSGGETFERFASAHVMLDYKNELNGENLVVWAPFHFLPGGAGATLDERAVCLPDSEIARDAVRDALAAHGADNAIQRLGVTLHAYVDTWAHRGFSGKRSLHNVVLSLEGDDHDHESWAGKVKSFLGHASTTAEAWGLDAVSLLGHGAALHFPDMPWAKWKYTNGHRQVIARDNLPDFVQAADMACRVVRAHLAGAQKFEDQPGLPDRTKQALAAHLAAHQEHDADLRLERFADALAAGKIDGIREPLPEYIAKGEGSWKHLATGITAKDGDGWMKPEWSHERFENSHYRKFHDAVKQHRFAVTQKILPSKGIRLA